MGGSGSIETTSKLVLLDEKVVFLWTAPRHRQLCRLSANIKREICAYLHSPQPLVQVREDEVRYFDLGLKQWKRLYGLQPRLPEYHMDYSLTFVDDFYLFVCGGTKSPASAHMLGPNRVLILPDMLLGRHSHTVAYVATYKRVCVFGGCWTHTACEAYYQQVQEWKPLPAMRTPRNGTNAVVRGDLIYLCGGDNKGTVEMYSALQDTMTLLKLTLPFSGGCVVTQWGDLVLCIAAEVSVWWNVREQRVVQKLVHPHCRVSCICPPHVVGSQVYVAATLECRVYSLSAGQLLCTWR